MSCSPWHHLQLVHERHLVLQALVLCIDILDLKLKISGAIGAGLGAALLPERHGFDGADGERGSNT